MVGQIGERILDGAEGVRRGPGKALSGRGQFDPRPRANEELLAQMLFERCDGVADRGLRDAQFLSGSAEAAQPRRDLEGEERTCRRQAAAECH